MDPILSSDIYPLAISISYFLSNRNSQCQGHDNMGHYHQYSEEERRTNYVNLIYICHIVSAATITSVAN
jgi:hypothetical protein